MNAQQKEFLRYVRSIADKNNIKIQFSNTRYIREPKGIGYSGYFDGGEKTLVVATKKKLEDWFAVFVHETCHMDQFLENSKAWDPVIKGKYQKYDPMTLYDLHVDRIINLAGDVRNEVLSKVINIELDCEKRSVKKIKKFELGLDVSKYIRHSNICLYDYSYTFNEQTTYPLKKIIKHPANVINMAPSVLYKTPEEYFVIPENVKSIFDEVVKKES